MFWTKSFIYNPITKGVVELVLLKRMFLIIFGVAGVIGTVITLLVHNTTEPAVKSVEFPCCTGQYGIVIQAVDRYCGPYVEDGSDEIVSDVASAVVYNSGEFILDAFVINLNTNTKTYRFEATMLLPGMRVSVLDINRSVWHGESIMDYSCTARISQYQIQPLSAIELYPISGDEILLVNKYVLPVCNVSIFHKAWDESSGTYLGGVTYKTYIKNFRTGDRLVIKPIKYNRDQCKIIWMECG